MTPCDERAAGSYYEATAGERPDFAALQGTARVDACVVGGGLTGLSAALELAERGFQVLLLETGRVGCGASGRNGGQLGSGQRRGQRWLERRLGAQRARLLWEMAEEARRLVLARIERHAIDCHWRPGNLLAITRQRYVAEVEEEARHLASRYGYDALSMLDREQMRAVVGSERYVAGCLDRGGGHLHPLRYVLGLARAAAAAGARIHEHSQAAELRWGRPSRIRTAGGGEVLADHVLLCGNAYLGDRLEPRTVGRTLPIVNHLLATEPLGEQRARGILRESWCVHSTKFVVDYFRLSPDRRLIFGGGETYSDRPPADLKGFVRRHMLEVFPQLHDVAVDHAWSGRLAITRDRLPEFGRTGVNGWYVQGYSGYGLALTQLAGRLLAEAVAGDARRFDVFARLRPAPFPGGRWLRKPLLVAGMLWYALRDRF